MCGKCKFPQIHPLQPWPWVSDFSPDTSKYKLLYIATAVPGVRKVIKMGSKEIIKAIYDMTKGGNMLKAGRKVICDVSVSNNSSSTLALFWENLF